MAEANKTKTREWTHSTANQVISLLFSKLYFYWLVNDSVVKFPID